MSDQETCKGGCLCGAVRYELTKRPADYHACHCATCRKFGGGAQMSVMVEPGGLTWLADTTLKTYKSSEWAERGFCNDCGSSLFWRLTVPGPMEGLMYLSVGSLDDMEGIPFHSEVYIDHKPDSYAFAGDRKRLTEAEVMAMVAGDV